MSSLSNVSLTYKFIEETTNTIPYTERTTKWKKKERKRETAQHANRKKTV